MTEQTTTAGPEAGFPYDLYLSVPKGAAEKLKATVETQQPLLAPIAAGQKIGVLRVEHSPSPDGTRVRVIYVGSLLLLSNLGYLKIGVDDVYRDTFPGYVPPVFSPPADYEIRVERGTGKSFDSWTVRVMQSQ